MKRFFAVSATSLATLLFTGPLLFQARTRTIPLPTPTVDRVGFPANYQSTFLKVYAFDNAQNRQIRVVWANPIAASVTPDTVHKFPFGSIIVMETYGVMEDASGEPILDANGRFIPSGAAPTIFVQRKERGFGGDYGLIRNGDWEYVAYKVDGPESDLTKTDGRTRQSEADGRRHHDHRHREDRRSHARETTAFHRQLRRDRLWFGQLGCVELRRCCGTSSGTRLRRRDETVPGARFRFDVMRMLGRISQGDA